jgi:hypothetical protein
MNITPNQANSIIEFPSERIVRYPTDGQKLVNDLRRKKIFVDEILQEHMGEMGAKLLLCGVDISSQEFCDRFALSIEALRSAMYHGFNIEHPYEKHFVSIIEQIEQQAKEKE